MAELRLDSQSSGSSSLKQCTYVAVVRVGTLGRGSFIGSRLLICAALATVRMRLRAIEMFWANLTNLPVTDNMVKGKSSAFQTRRTSQRAIGFVVGGLTVFAPLVLVEFPLTFADG